LLVGEIGTGKTTLIYSLLSTQHRGVRTAWVANPRLSFEEMLRLILEQLGVEQSITSGKLALLQAFDRQLASLGPDECVAVIIDEAQDLSDDALEDLRLLSNFQSLERRRLQIVLVGQIELARRLGDPQLRQLNQRIGARALLPTLHGKEIHDYVEYRLRARGGDIDKLFAREAIRDLARVSGGIPRRINALCHNALLLAYAQEKDRVTAQHILDALHDYDSLLLDRASAPAKMAAFAISAIKSAGGAIGSAAAGCQRMAAAAAPILPTMRSAAAARAVRTVAAASIFGALFFFGMALFGFFQPQPERAKLDAPARQIASRVDAPRSSVPVVRSSVQLDQGSGHAAIPASGAIPESGTIVWTAVNVPDRHPDKVETAPAVRGPAEVPSTTAIPAPVERKAEAGGVANISPSKLSSAEKISKHPEASPALDRAAARPRTTVVVRAGDTLSKIALRLYGSFGTDELGRLTAANPQIKDADLIYPGQSIHVQRASN
jgi:type II secretory pathway predicted ATPase ExeA/nucleoid-associated protein YgaU